MADRICRDHNIWSEELSRRVALNIRSQLMAYQHYFHSQKREEPPKGISCFEKYRNMAWYVELKRNQMR